jgi:probable HAF family extracellular repeat protein
MQLPMKGPSSAPSGESTYEVVVLDLNGVLHDVNDRGDAVGQWVAADGTTRAIHVAAGVVTELGTLGGASSVARGINDDGLVVGGALTSGDERFHAFVYEHGIMRDINDLIGPHPEWELIQALGINAQGDIVALGHRSGVDCVVLLKRRRDPA